MYTDSKLPLSLRRGQSGTLVQSRSLSGDTAWYFCHPSVDGMVVRGPCADLSTGAAVAVRSWMFASCGQGNFNTNDNGRMILSQTVDQDNNRLTTR